MLGSLKAFRIVSESFWSFRVFKKETIDDSRKKMVRKIKEDMFRLCSFCLINKIIFPIASNFSILSFIEN